MAQQRATELLVLMLLSTVLWNSKVEVGAKRSSTDGDAMTFCLSWRLGVEPNNVRAWRTVLAQCLRYIQTYMTGGQYARDLDLIVQQISTYVDELIRDGDGHNNSEQPTDSPQV